MGNTINVAGSYIDIHDNEVVNLTVDKGVVNLSQESQQVNAVEAEGNQESEGAEELLSDKAMSYWKALQEAVRRDDRSNEEEMCASVHAFAQPCSAFRLPWIPRNDSV